MYIYKVSEIFCLIANLLFDMNTFGRILAALCAFLIQRFCRSREKSLDDGPGKAITKDFIISLVFIAYHGDGTTVSQRLVWLRLTSENNRIPRN